MIDMDKERARLSAEIDQLQAPLDALLGLLSNEKFMAKAPPAVVDGERAKAAEWQARLAQLRAKLDQLGA
jgi:valyl-tRNA synthetase